MTRFHMIELLEQLKETASFQLFLENEQIIISRGTYNALMQMRRELMAEQRKEQNENS